MLHNICEIHGEAFNDGWLSDEVSGSNFPQPSTVTHHAVTGIGVLLQLTSKVLECSIFHSRHCSIVHRVLYDASAIVLECSIMPD